MIIAPVSVAKFIIARGAKRSCAYHSTSARTRRPSASVLMTSIVSPFIETTTSPGRCAQPSGIFSTKPTRPTTLARALRKARPFITPATTPAPPISMVISSMPAAGFRLMPPVSNTTPLPTRAKGCASPAPIHSITTTLDGLSEPCPTPKRARIPNFSSAGSSRTSTLTPSAAKSLSCSAKLVVVRTLAGALTRSRVKNTPSATAKSGAAFAVISSGLLQ